MASFAIFHDVKRLSDCFTRVERSLNVLSRPAPIRENPDVLIRGISAVPLVEGEARSLAVALGYAEYADILLIKSLRAKKPSPSDENSRTAAKVTYSQYQAV